MHKFYSSTDGQKYWSDQAKLSHYPQGYLTKIDQISNSKRPEIITELYVPCKHLRKFMGQAAQLFKKIVSKRNLWDSEAYKKSYRDIFAWHQCHGHILYLIFILNTQKKGLSVLKSNFKASLT